MLRLTRWLADYYLCPWATVLDTVLPAGVRAGAGTRLTTFLSIDTEAAKRISQEKFPPKQAAVLKELSEAKSPMTAAELARAAKCGQAPIKTLQRKGLIRSQSQRVQMPQYSAAPVKREKHLVLNADQHKALSAILEAMNSREHRTILIHGVTGSGKTEVYIQAIQEVIRFGRQAIVLVPEISLTPQTVERFRSRFGEVAVLHSHLSDAERHWHWQRIAEGVVSVVVGAHTRDFRTHAAPGAHRVGRRARIVVQARLSPAISRPGRGLGPGEGRIGAAGPRFGYAIAGKLAPRTNGRIYSGGNAPPRFRPPAARCRHGRSSHR